MEAGALAVEEGRDLTHALETVLRARLDAEVGGAGRAASLEPAHPSRLDAIERAALREAFRTIRLFQKGLAERFRTRLS